MAKATDSMRAEALEQEIEQDRRRIEERIDAIQARMSPGQLLDEALNWAKSNGGSEYAANLGAAMKTNPVPVALMGISMAWLMANPAGSRSAASRVDEEPEHPLATIKGSVRRVGPVQIDGEYRYSHFTDEGGSRFKALTDESGRRAGHFMDEAGRTYRGFADATGRQIHDIRDETGRLFDEASGWISRSWKMLGSAATSATDTVFGGARTARDGTMAAGGVVRDQMSSLSDSLVKHFRDQPLVGGALAFALGAAIGAALPGTRTEDEAMGEAADDLRDQLASKATDVRQKAEQTASEVYGKAKDVVSEVHDTAKERIAEETRQYQRSAGDGRTDTRTH